MNCARCGVPLQPGARFCGNCGAPVEVLPPPGAHAPLPPPEPPTPLTTPLQVVEQTPVATSWADAPTGDAPVVTTQPVPVVGTVGPARITPLVVVAALTGALAVYGTTATLYTIEAGGVVAETVKANVFENVTVAAVLATVVLLGGAVLASTGRRMGAGLAGGAGLAVAGLSALLVSLGLAAFDGARDELGGASLPDVVRTGFWVLAAAGLLGLVVFLMSLRAAGSDGLPRLHGALAALGTLATAALAAGPFLPRDGASFGDNFTADPSVWPSVAKCVALGLVLVAGVVGFASLRRWGIGLALGGVSVAAWQWVTTLTQDNVILLGVGFANPGDLDFSPHGLTTAGLVGVVACAVAALATARRPPAA